MFDMVESGIGAGIAHSDSDEVVVVEGVLVVVSCARRGVHAMGMLSGVGISRGGVTVSGSVLSAEHVGDKVSVGGVTSIGIVSASVVGGVVAVRRGEAGWCGGGFGGCLVLLNRCLRCCLSAFIFSVLVMVLVVVVSAGVGGLAGVGGVIVATAG